MGAVVVVAQEVQVAHEGAAGHLQFMDEVAAIGGRAGTGAFADHFQDALQAVVLGPGGGFHLLGPVPLDGTGRLYAVNVSGRLKSIWKRPPALMFARA
jgi:hypothetical protein